MGVTRRINDEQMALWNGTSARAWVEAQGLLDQVFKPFQDLLVAGIPAEPGSRVLDVGCGTGSTTLAVARALGSSGESVGIDISEPMLALAQARAASEGLAAKFIRADAQIFAFQPASFDAIISRFGVMFFEDAVQAFTNLRRAAKANCALRFVAWRSPEENPFMTTAERAAGPLLQTVPARDPQAPGQFAFADRNKIRRVLEESGWTRLDIHPTDVECVFPEVALEHYISRMGPVGRVLQNVDDRTRTEVLKRVRPAFDSYIRGSEVHFTAACWLVNARPTPL
jgi:ubiquinone/menaquinone biosynthesis C-methylase UbiE